MVTEDYNSMEEALSKMRTRKAALTYLAQKIPERDFKSLKGAFIKEDEINMGTIPTDKFVRCLSFADMKFGEMELQELLKELNKWDSGVVGYQDFLNCCYLSYIS